MQKDRIRKINKYVNSALPEAQLDFHCDTSLSPREIDERLKNFIDYCEKNNFKKVLIITGKGLHSQANKPIVKPLVEDSLKKDPRIKFFTSARMDRGAQGAFEVILY